jgi:hypothetical protein
MPQCVAIDFAKFGITVRAVFSAARKSHCRPPLQVGRNMTAEITTACIVVVETGADEIPSIDDPSCSGTERVIIAQQPDETPAELAMRVSRRAQDLARTTPIESAVIVASDTIHDDVFASRCLMARALVRAMSGASSARLLFTPRHTLADEGRHELLSIAGTLAMQLGHVPVEVSVRFASPPPEPQSAVRLRKPRRIEPELGAALA